MSVPEIPRESPPTALDDQLENDDETGFYHTDPEQTLASSQPPSNTSGDQIENDDETGFYHTEEA